MIKLDKTAKLQRVLAIMLMCALIIAVFAGCNDNSGNNSSSEQEMSADEVDHPLPDDAFTSDADDETNPEINLEDYVKMNEGSRLDGFDLTDEEIEELKPMQYEEPQPGQPTATMVTSMGQIRIVLYPEVAPLAVENFVTHAQNGYYNGLIFHRVMNDFMIQGGDPLGEGFGGDSIYTNTQGQPIPFEDEPSLYAVHFRGALSMANSGSNTNGSQFFIVQAPESTYPEEYLEAMYYPKAYIERYTQEGGTPHLDFQHTVFGMVIEGMDVVDTIAAVETDANDKPLEAVTIESITIENA